VPEQRIPVAKRLAARNGGPVGLAALIAILLLGSGLRTAEAWDGRSPVYDAAAYATIAANLERGEGFTLGAGATQPASNYSPGVPLFVGGLYELTGGVHERSARLVLALLGSLAVLFTYLIGRRLSGPLAGLIGAAVLAIYPALLEYQGMLMGELLAATLLSGAVLAMLWADASGARVLSPGRRGGAAMGFSPHRESVVRGRAWGEKQDAALSRHPSPTPPARGRWFVPGLLLGALALVRPEYVAIALPVAMVVLARRGWDGWREGVVQAAIMLVGLVIVVAPWTVRNAIALDRFVPVSTGGGQVLFAGSYIPSAGDPERVGSEVLERHPGLARKLAAERAIPVASVVERVRLEQILAALAKQRYPSMETDEALARMGRERLWDDVSEQPVDYAGFVVAKVWRIWSHGPRDVMREPAWTVFHLLLVALGLVGLIALARKRRWEALLVAVVLLSVTATGALLVASPRRVLVTIPLVAALAGAGATGSCAWLRSRIRH
jgi:4-amino-4-deoxy-L-arabinose transferase-like glycosyltransferase